MCSRPEALFQPFLCFAGFLVWIASCRNSKHFGRKVKLVLNAIATPFRAWSSSGNRALMPKKGVDSYSCHKANENDPAACAHYGHKTAVIVTSNYGASRHAKEIAQFEKSHHAAPAKFMRAAGRAWAPR